MIGRAALSALVLLVACAPDPHFRVIVDPGLSPAQVEDVAGVLEEWRTVTRGRLSYSFEVAPLAGVDVDGQTCTIREVARGVLPRGTGGRTRLAGGEIWMPPGHADFRQCVAHEIGHCFGLGHVTDRPSIMAPDVTAVLGPLPADGEAFLAIYGEP